MKYASRDSEKGDSKKVYVGALPRNIDDAALRTMFEEYGEIDTATVLKDIHTSESRGCALIKFKSAEAAGTAVSAMNGHDVGVHLQIQGFTHSKKGTGYKIVVKFAESEKEKDKRKKTLMKKYLPYNKMPTGELMKIFFSSYCKAPTYVPVPGYTQPAYAPPGIAYPPQPAYAYPYGQGLLNLYFFMLIYYRNCISTICTIWTISISYNIWISSISNLSTTLSSSTDCSFFSNFFHLYRR